MDDSVSIETASRSSSSSSSSTEVLTEFSIFIDKLTPLISRMKEVAKATDLPAIQKAVDSLETDYFRAKAAAESHVEFLVQSYGRSMGLVWFASHEAPMRNKLEVKELCKEMIDTMVMLCRFIGEEIGTDGDVVEAEEEEERSRNSSEEYAKNESKFTRPVNQSPHRSVPAAPIKICCFPLPRFKGLFCPPGC